jgi:hypothetical protein
MINYPNGSGVQLAAGGWTEFIAPIGMITANNPIQLTQLGQVSN